MKMNKNNKRVLFSASSSLVITLLYFYVVLYEEMFNFISAHVTSENIAIYFLGLIIYTCSFFIISRFVAKLYQ